MSVATASVIDVHAHYVPLGLRAYLRGEGRASGLSVVEDGARTAIRLDDRMVTRFLDERLWDLDDRVGRMDRAGVDVQVLSLWTDLVAQGLPPGVASALNDLIAADVAAMPDRFVGLANIPIRAPQIAATELARAVQDLNLVGVEIAACLEGPDLGDPALEPLWDVAEDLRCLVLLHPAGGLAQRLDDPRLDVLVGRPAETTIVVTRLILSGVLERHPDLNVCVVHGGGFLPYQIGRLERSHLLLREAGHAENPRPALRGLYYDTVLNSPAALRFLIDQVGSERVLLGSDDPFEVGDPTPRATIEAIPGLTTRERHALFAGNARRLFEGIVA